MTLQPVYGLCPPCGRATINFGTFTAVGRPARRFAHTGFPAISRLSRSIVGGERIITAESRRAMRRKLRRPAAWMVPAPCGQCGRPQYGRLLPVGVFANDYLFPIGRPDPKREDLERARAELNSPGTRERFARYHAARAKDRPEPTGYYRVTFPDDGEPFAVEIPGPARAGGGR